MTARVVVSVSEEDMIVRPVAPLGLLAMPSMCDLDHRIPLDRIIAVKGILERKHAVLRLDYRTRDIVKSIRLFARDGACGELWDALGHLGVQVEEPRPVAESAGTGPSQAMAPPTSLLLPLLFWLACTIVSGSIMFHTMWTGLYVAVAGLAVTLVEWGMAMRAAKRKEYSRASAVASVGIIPIAVLGWVMLFDWDSRLAPIFLVMLLCQCGVAWASGVRSKGPASCAGERPARTGPEA
jgi:hypothetical protein